MSNSDAPKALVIHHLRTTTQDAATQALIDAGYDLDQRYPIDGDRLPHPDEGHDVALVHGSLADVTKLEAPGIAEECKWIEAWWQTGRPYFGICHGLQLASQMLGAFVGPPEHGQSEFGYYPLLSYAPEIIPDGLHVFQWHYYGAGLPQGARRIAGSELYPNQVVGFGSVRYGLQCHAELSVADQAFLRAADPDAMSRPGAQDAKTQEALTNQHFESMRDWIGGFLKFWLKEAKRDT